MRLVCTREQREATQTRVNSLREGTRSRACARWGRDDRARKAERRLGRDQPDAQRVGARRTVARGGWPA
eukprot:6175844-Pleurochrysis_carterae.AAC.2